MRICLAWSDVVHESFEVLSKPYLSENGSENEGVNVRLSECMFFWNETVCVTSEKLIMKFF